MASKNSAGKVGFLLVDKPAGISSFQVINHLRKVSGIRTFGHAGTLDPLATGLMLIAVDEARKCLPFLEGQDKEYLVEIKLGAVSNTYDADGELKANRVVNEPTFSQLEQAIGIFHGEMEQKPPLYSAIKINGRRAYDYARKGQEVELKSRKVIFREVEIVRYEYPKLLCRVSCSSGTYVRSFAHDLGQILGCGAYVNSLQRVKIGAFSLTAAVGLNDLNEQNFWEKVVDPQIFCEQWPKYTLLEDDYEELSLGAFIVNRTGFVEAPILAIYKNKTVGILEPVANQRRLLKFFRKFNTV